ADNLYLIRKRPNEGLLANLWEFPTVEVATSKQYSTQRQVLSRYLEKEYETNIQLETGTFTHVDHIFSHLTWSMDVFAGEISKTLNHQDEVRLVTQEELETLAFPVPHQKIWKAYKEIYAMNK